jgi:hypothetical protein
MWLLKPRRGWTKQDRTRILLPRQGNPISIAVNISTRLLPHCGRGMDKIKMNQITSAVLNSYPGGIKAL